ncbi:MAG: glycosyltransferase family 2 protein [Aphanothece sp. CMT-3BRIN-NPC111]|jgi:tetratricopeptide (TPR) repeat protein|nr:glycosyltransferase family 2 protein [Aphanothece sp. CMT-3BRIN-NPC111]
MSFWKLNTPVVLFIFNRPETTAKVFEAIRCAQPPTLFVIADGARSNRSEEEQKCAAARAVLENVDWQCEVVKNYSETNMGCGQRVASGISWVFEQVNEAIFLEDDCWPHPTFFRFGSELLEKYRNDERIMQICGTNSLNQWKEKYQSYHFSYYGSGWGWASWRRAWQYYDYEMKLWHQPEVKQKIFQLIGDAEEFAYLEKNWEKTLNRKDIWDYQWSFAQLAKGGFSIVPAVNLVKNIGFGKDATHTTAFSIVQASLNLHAINFPLQEPSIIAVDREYDRQHFLWSIGKPDLDSLISLALRLIKANRNIYALMVLQQAIAANCDRPELNYYQAVALAQLNQRQKAIATLKHLLFLLPEHQEAHCLLKELSQHFPKHEF